MLPASPVGLLALALASTPADVSAATAVDECESQSPRIELSAFPSAKSPVVCIGSGLTINFRFDAPLQRESLKLEDRGWFLDWAVGQQTVTLVPRDNLVAGRRTDVTVCFADDAAPPCTTLVLLVHPGLGMQEVKVLRQARSVAYFQQMADEAQDEVQQLRAEVQQLRSERSVPDGLRGALASGLVDGDRGVAVKDLTWDVKEKEGNALIHRTVTSYRAKERVAVEVYLTNLGTMPWTAAGAVLRSAKGEVLKPLPLWPPEPVLPATPGEELKRGRVVVEVLATEKEAQGTYTLILWDAERQRTVTLGNVTFP
ncbi:hypothetical protein CYFUS_008880 [Cystobacter fuscus]|uniref:DUF2381 family protein n=1 Tax=Cystobacter fuscus TaxID=43 RepID=A0A250JIE5_9BACT|nr:DUF2381 family protein [Cystobacter fuscus]ATB43400.1 hypothetical protein CYFUS_008880 [Cystobacter fuscus]